MEIAKSIKAGTFELICPEMELLTWDAGVALKGTGVLHADSLGRLFFRLIAPFAGKPHESLRPQKRAGEMYRLEDHLILRAIDERGREWRSNRMIVNESRSLPVPNYAIRKRIGTVAHWRKWPKKIGRSHIRILIPGCPPLPFDMTTQSRKTVGEREIGKSWSRYHHTRQIGGTEVCFRQEGDRWLSVSASQEQSLMPTWPGLMRQALEFATVQEMNPVVITRVYDDSEELSLHSGPFWRFESQMPPPVDTTADGGARAFWGLVEAVFRYLDVREGDDMPLLDELQGIRRGAQGSFETACLTLGVGIESIAKLLLTDEPVHAVPPGVIQALIEHIDSWPGDARVKERAKGTVSRLGDTSAADRLYEWAARSGASKGLVDGWKRIRHPKAHGGTVGEEQSGLDLYYSCVELLYRIIATAIAYDGPILPTSQRGWGLDSEVESTEDTISATDDEKAPPAQKSFN